MVVPAMAAFSSKATSEASDTIRKETTVQREKINKKKRGAKTIYICPMHNEMILDKPGKCSKCGMNLVKKEVALKIEPAKK